MTVLLEVPAFVGLYSSCPRNPRLDIKQVDNFGTKSDMIIYKYNKLHQVLDSWKHSKVTTDAVNIYSYASYAQQSDR